MHAKYIDAGSIHKFLKKYFFNLFFILFFLLITNQQNANEILIFADEITYDQKNNIIAKGKAKVLYENNIISSNLIIYSQTTGDITLPIEFSLKDDKNNYYYGSSGSFKSDFKRFSIYPIDCELILMSESKKSKFFEKHF